MICDKCGGGLLVESPAIGSQAQAWECLGCGQTDLRDRQVEVPTIGDLLAGRVRETLR